MPDLATYFTFLGAVLAMQAAPGPDTVLVVSRGIGQGRRTAFWTVLGMTLGAGSFQVPLLALGVASLVQSSPLAFAALRWAGAAYLVWLGVRLIFARARADGGAAPPSQSVPAVTALREGLVANLTNPGPMMFMLAFLPQFVAPERGSVTAQLIVLGLTQKATGFAILGVTATLAGACGDWLARRTRLIVWQRRVAGAVMIGLGGWVALTSLRPARS